MAYLLFQWSKEEKKKSKKSGLHFDVLSSDMHYIFKYFNKNRLCLKIM